MTSVGLGLGGLNQHENSHFSPPNLTIEEELFSVKAGTTVKVWVAKPWPR